MTLAELLAACDEAEGQGLPITVLGAQRVRNGKRLAPPKRVAGSLRVECIGGKMTDWLVTVRNADARHFAASRPSNTVVPLRKIQPAEKMSREMRRMCGVDDPPADPWVTP